MRHAKHFKKLVSLEEIKVTKALQDMLVVQRGMRLSVQPVTPKEYDTICKMGGL